MHLAPTDPGNGLPSSPYEVPRPSIVHVDVRPYEVPFITVRTYMCMCTCTCVCTVYVEVFILKGLSVYTIVQLHALLPAQHSAPMLQNTVKSYLIPALRTPLCTLHVIVRHAYSASVQQNEKCELLMLNMYRNCSAILGIGNDL